MVLHFTCDCVIDVSISLLTNPDRELQMANGEEEVKTNCFRLTSRDCY